MVCDGYTKVWDLASGELVKLDGARGTTLRVTRGTLWLTQEHDTRDFVLSAGDVYIMKTRKIEKYGNGAQARPQAPAASDNMQPKKSPNEF